MIKSYQAAQLIFSKARKPESGKPLEQKPWRLYKEGDIYVVKVAGYPVAWVQPDNTLRFVLPNDTSFSQLVVFKLHEVLPFVMKRRSDKHYRVHPVLHGWEGGNTLGACGYISWDQFNSQGYRLYDGLTFDLSNRTPIDYREPQRVVDRSRNVEWLRKSKALKLQLRTMAKLGAFETIYEEFTNTSRWETSSILPILPHEHAELALFIDALDGKNMPAFIRRVGESIYSDSFSKPDVAYQLRYIDDLFTRNSLTLRKTLGVVTIS
jgi:hypothetical protein